MTRTEIESLLKSMPGGGSSLILSQMVRRSINGVFSGDPGNMWWVDGLTPKGTISLPHTLQETTEALFSSQNLATIEPTRTENKKKTRMVQLWDGVTDRELAGLSTLAAASMNTATKRAGSAAKAELERRKAARAEQEERPMNQTETTSDPVVDVDWESFPDDFLHVIDDGLRDVDLNSAWMVKAVNSLRVGIKDEQQRRREADKAPTYQGPGSYEDATNGTTMRIVGKTTIVGKDYALVGYGLADPNLWGFPVDVLEERDQSGRRRFELKHELGENQ